MAVVAIGIASLQGRGHVKVLPAVLKVLAYHLGVSCTRTVTHFRQKSDAVGAGGAGVAA